MIPEKVIDLFKESMLGIDGEPFLRGRLGDWTIYAYKLTTPMCLGHTPKVIEENGLFRLASWDEMLRIESAIAEDKILQPA